MATVWIFNAVKTQYVIELRWLDCGNVRFGQLWEIYRLIQEEASVFWEVISAIRPIVSYGAEAWTVTKKEEQAVLVFERKIFRRIYGAKYENGEWKSRTNWELQEMSKGENIVKWIRGQRISWLGHLERREEDRMHKKIFTQELEGTRRRGRPRKRWKDIFKC